MLTSEARELEVALRSRKAPALLPPDLDGEFILPEYQGHSLVNVPATLGELLGTPLMGISPPLDKAYWGQMAPGVRRVILVLLDALGYLQLGQMLRVDPGCVWLRLAQRGALLPMTSIYPSTTNTALASLLTGMEPISHGLLGYELWLREYGVLAEMLSLKPAYGTGRETLMDYGLTPETFLPVPCLGELLGQQDVRTTAIVPAPFTRGTLTRMCYRGFSRLFGYTNVDGMWAIARYVLSHDDVGRDLYMLYWGGIDSTIHNRGAHGGFWEEQFRAVSRACETQFLSQLTPREREGTLLIMIADHGFVDTPENQAHDTEADPLLKRVLLAPFAGEARAAYLYCFDGDSDASLQTVQQALGPDYVVRRTRDAVKAGLFGRGAPASESLPRLGHLHVISRGQHYLDRRKLRLKLRGRHGGLTPDEMLVPWLIARLDD